MLDEQKCHLTQTGTVSISTDEISISGFAADGGSCRDVAALALLWAIGELQKDLMGTLNGPGGGKVEIDG